MERVFENLRNERNSKQFAYILNNINHEGSDREKIAYFFQCFAEEYKKDLTKLEHPDYFVNHVAEFCEDVKAGAYRYPVLITKN